MPLCRPEEVIFNEIHADYNLLSEANMGFALRHKLKGSVECKSGEAPQAGLLIINADDWGKDVETTERSLECILGGTVSSVSALVFMEDSERAARKACERRIDVGLHLNFTAPFSAAASPKRLLEHQQYLTQYLRGHKLARIVYHPGLSNSFGYVIAAQLEEFNRLYGAEPNRIDGHHHMHLCMNVLRGGFLPPGIIVRRNFSFQPGEKSLINRLYRRFVDLMLVRRYHITDFLFSLLPLEPAGRLERIFSLARQFIVEVETHPINLPEYKFLIEGEIFRLAGELPIAPRFTCSRFGNFKSSTSLAGVLL